MITWQATEGMTMSSELFIRPGLNDHEVIDELLAPDAFSMLLPGDRRIPIDRVVADAHIAAKRPQLARAAASAGVPYMVDPLTHFWQTDLRDSDALAALPYGSSVARVSEDFTNPLKREALLAGVLDFEVDRGATIIVAPYLYARTPEDEWFQRSLELLEATRRRMDRTGLRLPLFAILTVGHQGFALPSTWSAGIDRFACKAEEIGATGIGVSFSPTTPKDSYGKVLATFAATARIKQVSDIPVYAWRQGIYGAGLTAAGIDGYETGIATSEACNIMRSLTSRRPKGEKKKSGGNAPGIFIDTLGRSVPASVGKLLLGSSLKARVICDDERCCPDGAASTTARPRQHAVRMRSRQLRSQDALPHVSWRLHQLSKDTTAGSTLILQANQILDAAGVKERLPSTGLDAMGRVARHLLSQNAAHAV
jgi:hypothetical protein